MAVMFDFGIEREERLAVVLEGLVAVAYLDTNSERGILGRLTLVSMRAE